MARAPGSSLVCVLTFALGIAALSTTFSWVDTILMHPIHGASDPGRLAGLESVTPSAPNGGASLSYADFRDLRNHLPLTTGVSLRRQAAFTLGPDDNGRLGWGELVSGNYFDVLGVRAQLGRTFDAAEQSDAPASSPVVVIGHQLWHSQFAAAPAVIGQKLRVNRRELTIIGVAPPEFHGAVGVLRFDFWVPANMGVELGLLSPAAFSDRRYRMFESIVRLRSGVTVEQASAQAAAFANGLAAAYPQTNRDVSAVILPLHRLHNGVNEYLSLPLRLLLLAAVGTLLIVCANVANLLLARSMARQREFSIRLALGASRPRLALQLLLETFLISGAGGLVSIPLLLWMSGSLMALVPSLGLPLIDSTEPDFRLLAFIGLVCTAVALVTNALPALFVWKASVHDALKDGGRAGTPSSATHRARGALVVAEVTLATVALVGAGAAIQSFRHSQAIPSGFDSSNVLLGRFFIESAGMNSVEIRDFAVRLQQQLRNAPSVADATLADFVPLSNLAGPYTGVAVEGYTPREGESMNVNQALVAPGYFATLHLPLLEGRDFNALDTPQAPPVAIVTSAFAERYFATSRVVGRRFRALGRSFTIVGLAQDGKYFSPTEGRLPFVYFPFSQVYGRSQEIYAFVRTQRDPSAAAWLLRQTVAGVEPRAAALHIVPLAEYTQLAIFGQKVAATMVGALGLMCLLLAAMGLYGVMAYEVTQRTHEIGIRLAIGATPFDVLLLMVRRGMGLTLAGLALGILAALAWASWWRPASLLIYAGSAAFLAFVALAATLLSVQRATRLDPSHSLRRDS
jgi:predicted permease